MNPVESFIDKLAGQQRELADVLRHFILSVDPEIREKISYGIPFFYKEKNICYLNPVAAGIDLGFVKGSKFKRAFPGIEMKNRKKVRTIYLQNADTIDFELLLSAFHEALSLDTQ